MEQNENKIVIIDEQGRERECEVLFTYQHPETLKNYVVLYPIDELDSDDDEMDLFAYSFVENENIYFRFYRWPPSEYPERCLRFPMLHRMQSWRSYEP